MIILYYARRRHLAVHTFLIISPLIPFNTSNKTRFFAVVVVVMVAVVMVVAVVMMTDDFT
jgi:amino acid permease